MRKAFTLLEMVFVIVIIGVIGSFSSDIFINAYKNYIFTLTQNRLEAKSSMALNFIAKKLTNRIRPATIARTNATTYVPIINHTTENIIEWIDSFYESKIDGDPTAPTFIPLIDLNNPATTVSQLHFPILNKNALDLLIESLSNSATVQNKIGLIFRGANSDIYNDYAWDYIAIADQSRAIHPVSIDANNTLTTSIGDFTGQDVWEFADIVWTARAIEYDSGNKKLIFYDNYRPWQGDKFTDAAIQVTIMENVSNFSFTALGEVIQLHICVEDPNLSADFGGGYALCKDKTIF